MYNKEFMDEVMRELSNFSNWRNSFTIVSYDEKERREMVSRYEKLVPELGEYHVELTEDSIMKLISLLPFMMQYFDTKPAEKTRIIKRYVSEEKMEAYATILNESFEEIKALLEAFVPEIILELKENYANTILSEDQQLKFKFAVILAAQKQCMKNGKISMTKAIRDYLKTHTVEGIFNFDEVNDHDHLESLKNNMSYVNKFFAWICEHEMDILKEFVFYMSKEEIFKAAIEERYSDPTPKLHENPTMMDFANNFKSTIESPEFKFTKKYDEYLEAKVNKLIVALGGTLKD